MKLGKRKGFQFSIVEEETQTVNVPFELIAQQQNLPFSENSKSTDVPSDIFSEKKRRANPTEASNTRPIPQEVPNEKPAGLTQKAHYPIKSYDLTSKLVLSDPDCIKLKQIVKIACDQEQETLLRYFQQNFASESDPELLEVLSGVCQSLSERIAVDCEDEATFSPEVTKAEARQLAALQQSLAQLTSKVEVLDKCLEDTAAYTHQHGIWTSLPKLRSEIGKTSEPLEIDVTKRFDQSVEGLNAICRTLLADVDVVRTDLQAARKCQEHVYNSFQKAKSLSVFQSGSYPPTKLISKPYLDPRDIIRNYQ